jgi:hypothetical protein
MDTLGTIRKPAHDAQCNSPTCLWNKMSNGSAGMGDDSKGGNKHKPIDPQGGWRAPSYDIMATKTGPQAVSTMLPMA